MIEQLGLTGRVGVVTGAARGIGLEIARFMTTLRAEVIMADINPAVHGSAAALAAGGSTVTAVQCDVSTAPGLADLVAVVEADQRGLSFLVNNAAAYAELPPVSLTDITEDLWDKIRAVRFVVSGTVRDCCPP